MQFIADYGIFLLKTLTICGAIVFIMAMTASLSAKAKNKEKLKIKKLNDHLKKTLNKFQKEVLPKVGYKNVMKALKKQEKEEQKHQDKKKQRIFVLTFHGDIKASEVEGLRESVSAVLLIAKPLDEVVVLLESPGGMVHQYGLAASQLDRIRQANIPLTVCVDKVAASGGYLMACVADKIIGAPFAIIGSIGVVAQFPNFHRWLKKQNIDFEQITAGEFKRTLTVFGENSEKDRKKMQSDIEDIHAQFKEYIIKHRPQVNIEEIATGDHWLGERAKGLNLLDKLQTSDDYLMEKCKTADVFLVEVETKKSILAKLGIVSGKLSEWVTGRNFC